MKERAELRRQPFHFNSIGLSLLVIVMICWEVMLSKGQEWDWLGDPFWRVQTLAILCGYPSGPCIRASMQLEFAPIWPDDALI